MTLFDTDKDGSKRISPKLNVDDSVANRMAHNTMSNTYRNTESVTQRMAFKNALLLTYDSENRVSSVYGYIPELSSVPVLIIAKDGYDVFVDILETDAPDV